jgi:hypothetical protein
VNGAAFAPLCLELLAQGTPIRFRASGSSMAPTIRDGELLHVVPLAGAVRMGCVVLYECGGRLTAHRVRRRDGETLVCQGDGWQCRPERVPLSAVRGVVVAAGDDDRGVTRKPFAFCRFLRRLRASVNDKVFGRRPGQLGGVSG